MRRLYYFWNGRIRGIPGASCVLLGSGLRKLLDIVTTLLVRNNLGKVGKKVRINGGVVYRYPGNITLGHRVIIARGVELSSENSKSKLTVGDDVVITFDARIDFSGGLTIGSNSLISKNTIIETHDHGLDPHAEPAFKSLEIGKNVWIGMNAVILPGVRKIGDNAVIAAGSVVTREVEANTLIGGVPASLIKKLN